MCKVKVKGRADRGEGQMVQASRANTGCSFDSEEGLGQAHHGGFEQRRMLI